MCGICGCDRLYIFESLIQQNIKRGNFSHSYTVYDTINKRVVQQIKSFDSARWGDHLNELEVGPGYYYLGHTQAPTNGLEKNFWKIHPSEMNYQIWAPTLLAHNGVLTDKYLKSLHFDIASGYYWDTHILHHQIRSVGITNQVSEPSALDNVEGSFACWYIDEYGHILIFRNPQAPLFCSGPVFSSMPFGPPSTNMHSSGDMIDYGVIYKLADTYEFEKTNFTFKVRNVYGL